MTTDATPADRPPTPGPADDDAGLDAALARLDAHLPPELRDEWQVVPRGIANKAFVIGLLLGGAAACLGAGLFLDIESLKWVWPATLGLLALTAQLVWRREERAGRRLIEWQSSREG